MKKIISLLLALVIACAVIVLPAYAAEANTSSTSYLPGQASMPINPEIEAFIPDTWTIDDFQNTRLDSDAFVIISATHKSGAKISLEYISTDVWADTYAEKGYKRSDITMELLGIDKDNFKDLIGYENVDAEFVKYGNAEYLSIKNIVVEDEDTSNTGNGNTYYLVNLTGVSNGCQHEISFLVNGSIPNMDEELKGFIINLNTYLESEMLGIDNTEDNKSESAQDEEYVGATGTLDNEGSFPVVTAMIISAAIAVFLFTYFFIRINKAKKKQLMDIKENSEGYSL